MTGKDVENNTTTAPAAAAPPSLPPLSEMITTAIEMLDDKAGSDKSTIQKHIESNYSSLPADFSESVSTQLEAMKHSGELVMISGCYRRAESSAPPLRRGRGRPPKPKPALPSGYVVPPARPRGRPPKAHDPLAPPPPPKAAATGGSGRKRGRPPKANKAAPKFPPSQALGATGERRGRGRPPKVRPPVVVPVGY